ncbi:MAG: dephospho-CoA kinase [Gammaproteobacteria bacterium]|nr:dephospho-CoA kinase [Gammaproteobacteria bacterium]
MLKVGLTGGIGSGKSTVSEIFSNLGITIIDADRIAHQLMQSGSDSFNDIRQLLGDEFININGELDRKKIAQTIFSNPQKKIALEKILHPRIKQYLLQEVERFNSKSYIILEIPLLLESQFTDLVDRIIVVDADDDIRIQRTKQRDNRTEEQIRCIMNHQIDRDHRLQQADDILNNNGNIEDLRKAVTLLHHKYLAMAA